MRTEESIEKRRTTLRIIFFFIIIGTLPFYLIGFWLWGTARANDSGSVVEETVVTNTPIGNGLTPTNTLPATWTPRPTSTTSGGLNPTPFQFIPPTSIVVTDTPVVIPQATNAPSLTPFPTNTPVPLPTNTPVPQPTATPIPSNTPLPTATTVPTNTPVPTDPPPTDPPPATSTPLLPPTDTPSA